MDFLLFLFVLFIFLVYLFVNWLDSLREYNSWNVEEMKARRNIEGLVAALKKYGKHKFGGHKQRAAEAALIEIGKPAVPALMTLYGDYDAVALISMLDRIGDSQAVIKLYIGKLHGSCKSVRVSAARALVRACYQGSLSSEAKRLILSVRHLIITPHTDKHTDCIQHCDFDSPRGGTEYHDDSPHQDKGIGVGFPL